jgi:4a-hydroxytetrahydrobiopterin dehydratase
VAREKLSPEEVASALSRLSGWTEADGKISKRFAFGNFADSLDFVNKAGAIAERRDHHPDITFGWGYAAFEITTHDAGGLTRNDFDLAADIDAI